MTGTARILKRMACAALAACALAQSVAADDSVCYIEKLDVSWSGRSGQSFSVDEGGDLLVTCSDNNYFSIKGQVSFAISGSRNHAPGSIELRIPARALTDRDGAKSGYVASLGVSSLDGWASRVDDAAGEVVIYNTETKPPAMEYTFEVLYAGLYPVRFVDMEESGRFSATAKIADEDFSPVTAQSNVVSAFVDTKVSVYSASKSPRRYYPAWSSKWGTAPADADDYFYVAYSLVATLYRPSQPFVLTIDDIPADGGELVGFADGYSLTKDPGATFYENYAGFSGGTTFSCHWISTDNCYPLRGMTSALVRYPKSLVADGLEHVFTNSMVATVVGDDDHILSVRTNSTEFTYYGGGIAFPGERYGVVKGNKNTFNGGTSRLLAGRKVEGARHLLLGVANCYETTLAPGADPTLAASYNQRTNSFELIDDFVRLASAPDRALTADDFEFDTLQFCDYSFYSAGISLSTNELGRISAMGGGPGCAFRDVKVWGKFDTDSWELIGTLERDDAKSTGSLWRFLPAMEGVSCEYNVEQLALETNPFVMDFSHIYSNFMFSRIDLPDNCTGIRLTAESAGSAIRIGSVYASYSLKPSAFIQSAVSGKANADVWNFDSFVVRDDEGRVLGPIESVGLSNARHASLPAELGSIIADKDMVDFGQLVGHSYASTRLTPFQKTGFAEKNVISNVADMDRKRIVVKYSLACFEKIVTTVSENPVAEGVFVPQSSGAFSDLLPLGMEMATDSVKVYRYYHRYYRAFDPLLNRGDEVDSSKFEVSTTPNWRETGRTLLAVAIGDVEDNYCFDAEDCASGFIVEFDAYYSWEAIMDYGSRLLNPMVYMSGNSSIASGLPDNGGNDARTIALADIDGDGNPAGTPWNCCYASSDIMVDPLMSAEAGLTRRVRAPVVGVNDWITGVACNHDGAVDLPPGAPYQYRLRTGTSRDSWKKGIVLYAPLEDYEPTVADGDFGSPQWRGAFVGVDVSQIVNAGFAPVVYYSTVAGLDVAAHPDLSDAATWSSEPPADPSAVTAVAVDCRLDRNGGPAVLEPSRSLVAILDMRAPGDSDACTELCRAGAHAFSQVYEHSTIIAANGASSTQMFHNEYTKVGILPPIVVDAEPAEKVYDSVPTNIAVTVATALGDHVTNKVTVSYFHDPSNPQDAGGIPPGATWSTDLCFTNVSLDPGGGVATNTVWYVVDVPGYDPVTNKSWVVILPRPVTILIGKAKPFVDGATTNQFAAIPEVPVSTNGFIGVEGIAYLSHEFEPGAEPPEGERKVVDPDDVDTTFRDDTLPQNYIITYIDGRLLAAAVDIRAYEGGDIIVVEFQTTDERGGRDIEVYAKLDGVWRRIGSTGSVGSGDNLYRIAVDGLEAGRTYEIMVVDDDGHSHRGDVAVESFSIEMVRLGRQGLGVRWESVPGATYLVQRVERLGDDWSKGDSWEVVAEGPVTEFLVDTADPAAPKIAFFRVVLVGGAPEIAPRGSDEEEDF